MKVLMQSRSNFYELKGGDTTQLLKTKEELEKLGVTVDISLEYSPDLSDYDIVHLSNVTVVHETYLQMLNAKKQGKPVVLSTIFWPMDNFEQNGQFGIRKTINKYFGINNIERIKALGRMIKNKSSRNKATCNLITIGYKEMQNYVVNNADLYLPNAEIEMKVFNEYFGIKKNNYLVVPNAIDAEIAKRKFYENTPKEFEQYRGSIICVGRIEPRKNQLALVKSLNGTNLPLILVGAISKNQVEYFQEVDKYIKQNESFHYLGTIDYEKLYQLYKVCKVSVLPSWLDTPGLVSLEAASMGCNLAISTRGSTREYFGDNAFYCEPDDLESIKNAVLAAYEKPQNDILKDKIFNEYTWGNAARKTLEGYQMVLEDHFENERGKNEKNYVGFWYKTRSNKNVSTCQ